MDLTDYRLELQKLLPAGPAWEFEEGDNGYKLLDAWAEELARVQSEIDSLVNEADPRTTYRLLPDYERIFGIPTDCMAYVDQTIDQRRKALLAQMTSTGGQSIAYFIALALTAGFVITITEFRPFTVGMAVNEPIYDSNWAYSWMVNSALNTITDAIVLSVVNDPLRAWGNELLECILRRFKPAHTTVIFSYT